MNSFNICLRSLLLVLAISFSSLSMSAKDIVYVKSGSSGDGSSWSKAFGNIQQAVDAAAKKGADVWVSKGIYKSDSSAVVFLKPKVNLYGGFAGTETSVAVRDTAKNQTVLDGNGKIRVIYQNNDFADTSSVVVDGFTIQNGTADNGGGAYLRKNTTVSNCIIRNNKASKYGSAIYASSAVIKNCQIICNAYLNYLYYTVRLSNCVMDSCVVKNNKSYYYGAIYAESNSQISNCEIEGNGSAYYNNGYRGSYFNATKINNCKFVNTNGAGACVELANSSVMSRCLFEGNVNVDTHVISINGNSLAEDCQILSNKTTSNVLYLYNGKINRCTINGNTTSARILSMNYSSSSATNCLICNNNCSSTSYEPIYMYDRAVISNCTFVNNETKHGNFLYIYNSTLKNSILVGNKTNGNHSGFFNLGGTNTIKNNMLEATFVDGNIDGSMAYAAFTDAENGDYSLSANSYCINAGEEVSDSLDLYGKARKQGGTVDMGAIESAYTKAPVLQKCGDIIYVKSGSKGDGTSWMSAFGDIQQAIFAASADRKKHQIWVAAGTYYGDTTLSTVVNLAQGISLYGGFAGTETSLAARDTAKNPTIIDGKNQRRVITQNYGFADSMAVVVDGFTIQNGAAANGGGLNITANTTINNCIIKSNKASENGSAIYATSAVIKNCQIIFNTYSNYLNYTVRLNKCVMNSCVVKNNKSYYYGSIYAENNSQISNCEIEGNGSAYYNNGYRGSHFNATKIYDCKFVNTNGAGACVELANSSVMSRCLFEGNVNVGTHVVSINGNSLAEDCQILSNKTTSDVLYLNGGKINRCTVKGNTTSTRILSMNYSSSSATNSLFCNNNCSSTNYEPIYMYDRAVISNCTFVNNETKHGNVLYMSNSTLKNSIVVGNKTNAGYSCCLNLGGTNTVKNNMFEGTFVDGNMDGSMAYAAFTDAENGDYSLSSNSYCINAGEEVSDSLDLLGKARTQGGAVDMGAIESAYTKAPVLQKCGDIIYVKSGSKGDGTSWKSAFGDIQQAIFAASADRKKHQIWVAAGTYYGDTTLSTVVNLAPGISLYGGFAGTETSLAARDTAKNPTIIDGKNQRRVITQNYGFADSMAVVVDGFTIQNGTAAEGGGVNITANTTINNCIIKNNKASENGSAIYATSATIKNCQIVENTYTNRLYYTVRLNKCMMDSCVLRNNKTYYNSVIYAESNSNVTNCEIEGNSSYNNNIGSYFNSSKISNCKFVKTTGAGAGVELRNASVMRDCQFEGNTNVNNQIIYAADDNVLIEDCKIRNNTSTRNSFIYLSNSKINRCQITDNTVSSNVIESYNSKAKISNCLICDNTCPESYRTIYIYGGVSMINCTVARNVTKNANVIYMYNSTLKNSIIVGNTTNSNYSNILAKEGTNTIQNNMFEGTFVDGNIDGSMTFAAFTDAENGDYSLSANSYCINAGEDVADSLDLFGNARKQGEAVDMGAIESSYKKAPVLKSNEIVYVKSGSNGDGTSWESAFGDIPQAIFAASADGKKHQIWVAAGTYYGDTTLSTVVNLAPGISLYGGFAGNEKSLAARDTAKNPTILDGKNARRVVTQDYGFADSMAVVVDGFTIQNGYMNNGGGAYLCKNTTLNNCIVKNCRAIESGSAVYANGANVTNSIVCDNGAVDYNTNRNAALYLVSAKLDSCIVKNNSAYYTSALQAESSVITNSLFEGNGNCNNHIITLSKSRMYDCKMISNVNNTYSSDQIVYLSSGSTVERCLIDGNDTYYQTVYLTGSSTISNSQITKCRSRASYLIEIRDNSKMINCTVADNVSSNQTVYCYNAPQILNSIVVGNKRTNNSESVYVNGATIKYSMIEGGVNGEGNIDGSKSSAAFADASKGDYSLSGTSLCINAGTDVADSLDLNKNVRKQSEAVDMGAIESSFTERATVGSIIYVKAGSEGSGLSWDDALGEINQAVTLASTTGNRHDIWVAKGTYLGDTSLVSAISLSEGVNLYGGFAGTESSLEERDVKTNVTIIDGKNKRRCIIQNYDFADSLAVVVDGFTIQNGSLSNNSGVNAKTKKNTTFNNCIFRNARTGNESVYAEKSTFINCKFTENAIQDLEIYGGIIDSCSFADNTTTQSNKVVYLSGTRMSNTQLCGITNDYGIIDAVDNSVISHCKIMNNKTKYYNTVYLSYSTLENSLVCGNEIYNSGYSYSIISADYTSFITNSTIAHNKTRNSSAVSYRSSSSNKYTTIANSIIYGNKVTDVVLPQVVVSDCLKVKYCASDGDLTGENNIKLATSNSGSDASKNYVCFINAAGGDYRLHATSACIDKGLDSVMTAKTDINGGARVYGKAIDLGAIEFDGEYVQMLDYSQVVCNNRTSLEATFDSTISKIDWKIDNAGKVVGYETTSGSGTTIPSMQLSTSRSDIDTLTLKVTPYDKSGVAGVPFNYNYYVYPDFSKKKITFSSPKQAYTVNVQSTNMTIDWNKLSLPVDVDKYDLYVWKVSQKMPSTPMVSFVKDHSKYLSGLDNHTTYKYMVKASIACDTVCSDIDSFRIDIPVSLEISGSAICELGTKLNASTYSRRYVKGFELTDSISYSISGADAADFSVKLSNDWNSLTGGYYNVYYNPTDSKKSSSNATLTFKSGKYTAVMYLKGILANYYVFDALVEKDVYKAGDTIAIKGFVTDAYGNPFEGKRLKISLRKGGSEIRSFEETSNANGEAEVKYVSSLFESGVYTVGVCLSGESSSATFDGFDIPGISCSVGTDKWLVQKGDTVYGTVTVRNHSNVESRNVKVRTLTLADGCKVEFDSLDVLYGLESKKIKYYITGETLTEGTRYLPSTFRVETAEKLTADFTSYFYCEAPYGQIKVLPANIKEYVSKQNPKYIELLLCNTGFGETGKVSVALPDNFAGMSMPNGTEIESIQSGDTVKAILKLAYYDGAKLNTPINGSIGFNCDNGKSTSISYTMEYTSSLVGSVSVDVVDEYYYNSASKSHLAGATVEIKNAFNSKVIASGISDSTGKVRFDSIPEGDYLLCVKADKHSSYKETISVQAGQNLNKFVFITYQAVTYTWNVERVEIEDKYEIEIEAEYETNVPVPVVTAEFPNGLPNRESFNPGDKDVAYLVIANHGLIAAKDVTVNVPSMKHFKFTPDVDHIDSLPANYSVVVPVTIERAGTNGKFDPDDDDPDDDDPDDDDPDDDDPDDDDPDNDGPDNDGPDNDGPDNDGPDNDDPNGDDTGLDCDLILVTYSYECGEIIKKETYVKTWKCISSSPTGGSGIAGGYGGGGFGGYGYGGYGGGYGGSVNVGVSSVKTKSCDEECKAETDGLSCFMDIVGWIPVIGDFLEGTFKIGKQGRKAIKKVSTIAESVKDAYDEYSKYKDYIDNAQTAADIFVNGLDKRTAVSIAYDAGTTGFGFIPVVGDFVPFGCLDWWCQAHSCKDNGVAADNCGEYLYDKYQNKKEQKDSLRSAGATVDFYKVADPYLLAWHDLLEFTTFEIDRSRLIAECVGADDELMKKVGLNDYLNVVIDSISQTKKIDVEKVKTIPVSDLSLTDMIAISERWNRTVDAWNDSVFESNEQYPNIVNKATVDKYIYEITNFFQYVVFRGFEDIPDMVDFINDEMAKHNKKRKSVCASVKLHISQTLTMTREAFDGTLTVNNGNETLDMDNFKVVLEVRDEKGNLANDLFQINTQSLKGVASVDGTSSVGAGKEATAVFRFIPERGAAPKEPVNYSFGGKIIYVENGDTITMDLDPVTLTVNPSPNLQIDYFMQRNILGDDALTLDRVEPTVPAALGVRIDNQGYGIAKNVKLETAQPEIVDNKKGLLIDFAIIGSSLNGKDCDLGSENIDFGNIEPLTAKTGVWWLTSSLLGHFTKYEASVVHANSFGNPELSLVSGIAIHELVKTVDAYGVKEDHVTDFLVNDYESDDTPDAIYYSDGGKDTVKLAKKAVVDKPVVSLSDSVITLTVTPSESGWNYAQIADPGDNFYEIKKVVRVKDSVEIPLDNVWTTFVTLPDGAEPVYENRLHFLDYMTTLGENDYDIYYSIRKNILKVTEITGVPENEETVTTPVDTVVVKFNRKIQKESFDYNDIELYCQGGENLSDSTITVEQRDDLTYVINISSKTKTTGFYKIEINVNDVFDYTGYPGEFGKNASWNQFIDEEFSPVVDINDDSIIVYAYQNSIYVKSTKAGSLDIYDILSRLIVKNARYDEGVTQIAVLPKGIYIVNGNKVIVK